RGGEEGREGGRGGVPPADGERNDDGEYPEHREQAGEAAAAALGPGRPVTGVVAGPPAVATARTAAVVPAPGGVLEPGVVPEVVVILAVATVLGRGVAPVTIA